MKKMRDFVFGAAVGVAICVLCLFYGAASHAGCLDMNKCNYGCFYHVGLHECSAPLGKSKCYDNESCDTCKCDTPYKVGGVYTCNCR